MDQANSSDVLRVIGRAIANLKFEELPEEVIMRSRQRVLDTIGCLVAGYDAGISDSVRNYVRAQGGRAEASLLPGGEKTTVALASLAHATYIHGLELSDAAPRGTAHPGNEIVPPALAVAERDGLSGSAILTAVVAGYEAEIRFGRAIFPSAFYRGWWTPGMLGPIGSAVTTGYLLGLDADGFDNAIGIVLNLLPTATARANEEGHTIKWLIGGHACATGVLAADMAARGTQGMRDVAGGWLPIITDDFLPERLIEGIGSDGRFTQWEITSGIVTKHYATVGPLTSALDATFDLIKQHDIKADDVVEVEAECMRRTAVFNTVHPENEITARASLPYCLAVALCTQDPADLLGVAFTDKVLKDPKVHAVADRVRIIENEDYERQYPAKSLAKVTLKLRNGASYSQEVDRSARGRYLTPTDEDIVKKFNMVATRPLGEARAEKVANSVLKLEEVADIRDLIGALQTGD